jgi:hypothetical protein
MAAQAVVAAGRLRRLCACRALRPQAAAARFAAGGLQGQHRHRVGIEGQGAAAVHALEALEEHDEAAMAAMEELHARRFCRRT